MRKRQVLVIIAIAFASGFLISLTEMITSPIIRERRENFIRSFAESVFPGSSRIDNVNDEYRVYAGSGLVGYIIPAVAPGYSSDIKLLVILDSGGTIKKVVVTDMSETPGIGDRVSEGNFLERFIGKRPDEAKRVDSITGATVSSSAVKEAVAEVKIE